MRLSRRSRNSTERLKVLETGAARRRFAHGKRTRASSSTTSGSGRRSHARAASETAADTRQRAASASGFSATPNEYGSATAAAAAPLDPPLIGKRSWE